MQTRLSWMVLAPIWACAELSAAVLSPLDSTAVAELDVSPNARSDAGHAQRLPCG